MVLEFEEIKGQWNEMESIANPKWIFLEWIVV
ncbi:MAG: hypothetical protein UW70_C0040G0004 [Candidatus Peregrinibacteria bacterium GW2011_GWA2_44_7]|nr:MAG: hypothetical protein UW70_C0040G0004 [Candidatus Peregrinibacteria bacterium GW2011_GWA2_44_7]